MTASVGGRIPVINPDNIARTLTGSATDASLTIQAGRLALRERTARLEARETFGIETTLTGRSELDLMRAAVVAGYQVNLVYIGLRDVQHSIARVRERARRGGHDVPLADLLRRFDRSTANLREAAAIANHRLILLDNSGNRRRLVFTRMGKRVKYRSPQPPAWAARLAREK